MKAILAKINMSKRRSLDSKIRQSQSFAKLTYRQRDLWQGLIAIADDQGRFPGTQAHIRSMVWPLDDISLAEVEIDLLRLIDLEMIYRYQINDETFIQIINWWKYQTPQWAGKSDYPPPLNWIDRTRYHGRDKLIITENWDQPGGFIFSPDKSPDKSGEEEADKSALILTLTSPLTSPLTITPISYPNPTIIDAAQAQRIFMEVTNFTTFPSTSRKDDIERICSLYPVHLGNIANYLKPFWQEWTKRGYSKTYTAWLDWAVAGEIPLTRDQKKQNKWDEEWAALQKDNEDANNR